MVSVMRFEVLTLVRRWYKLHCFTLFTDKLCSDVIKAYLFSSLPTHPLKSFSGTEMEVESTDEVWRRDIATNVIEV